MRSFKKPLGILLFIALCMPGSLLVVEAKTKQAFAQETTSSTPKEVNLEPTKWEALELLGRGELPKGTVINAVYTQEELNGLIEGLLASKNISWFLDNASVELNKGTVEFSGRMLRPIKGNLVVSASVSIHDGNATINVHSARYGIFRVPASFVERVGNFILKKKSMSEWLDIKNAHWEDFTVKEGSLHIYVIGE